MLPERDLAAHEAGLHRRIVGGSQILLPEQPVHGTGADAGEKHPLRVDPTALDLERPGTDEHRPRRAERHELVGVHRQVVRRERTGVLQIVAGHPVVLALAGHVLHLLAEVAAVQLGAAGAR
jgi:hypothetical protein